MPVRLTIDEATSSDGHRAFAWRISEMRIEKARRVSGIWMPVEASLSTYRNSNELHSISRLTVEKLTLNQVHAPERFKLNFPTGYGVYDQIRGISYKVGDSDARVAQLLSERRKEDEFFKRILGKPAPDLSAAQWLVGKPLKLSDLKGRKVTIHFWNIWCAPCVAELGALQERYEEAGRAGSTPAFISVHTGGGAKERPQIQKFLKEHKITFPVMLDAPDPEEKGWGLTSERYGVFAIPTDAIVDEKGLLMEVGDRRVEP